MERKWEKKVREEKIGNMEKYQVIYSIQYQKKIKQRRKQKNKTECKVM